MKSSPAQHSLHSKIKLARSLPDAGLDQGTLGVIVHVHRDGEAYEVELFDAQGRTLDVVTLVSADLLPS